MGNCMESRVGGVMIRHNQPYKLGTIVREYLHQLTQPLKREDSCEKRSV
jgi:hypothetical protein